MEKAAVENNGREKFTITWTIENYSSCLHNLGEELTSPAFIPDGFDNTSWCLHLYPRGYSRKDKGNVSVYLCRDIFGDEGPEVFPLTYELSVLAPNGSVLGSRKIEFDFEKGVKTGSRKLVQIDMLRVQKAEYFPLDTLNVCCKMWKDDGDSKSVIQMNVVTRIEIEQISFLHVVKDFSALKPKEKSIVNFQSPSTGIGLTSSLYYSDDLFYKGLIIVGISTPYSEDILSKCNFFIIGKSGQMIECGKIINIFGSIKKNIKSLPLSLLKTDILNRKKEYLPNDELSVLCDCTFNRVTEKVTRTLYQLPSVIVDNLNNIDQTTDKYNSAEKLSKCSSALDDLKAVYDISFLTDVKLETKTKSFPAHKIFLCARSPVFKAMLTNDMKESYMDCIRVDDLENDTIEQLLNFLYSDNIENLQWESAIKLYYASDKYAIEKLKVVCTSFLVSKLSTSTAVELLILADRHNDVDLVELVQNFILDHEDEIYCSDEWEKLLMIDSQLVSKTMCLKYKRKREILNKT